MNSEIRVLAFGWYGAGNMGDELLLDMLKRWCHEMRAGLSVLSVNPMHTQTTHQIEAIDAYNLPFVANAMQNSDLFVLGGGGLFQTNYAFTIPALYSYGRIDISAYARPVLMARQMGLPTLLWAQGVGPLAGGESRQIVREIFSAATYVSVRDEGSRSLLTEIGVARDIVVAPDPVWAYPVPKGNHHSASIRKRVALVLRPWSFVQGWEDCFIEALKNAVPAQGHTLVWMPFQALDVPGRSESDVPYVRNLMQRVGGEYTHEWLECTNVSQVAQALGDCDSVVSMRLHAQILALRMGKPTLCIEYDPKMTAVSVQIGVSTQMRLTPDAPIDVWCTAFRVWADSEQPAQVALEKVEYLTVKAMTHRQVLRQAIEMASERTNDSRWQAGYFDWLGAWADVLSHQLWTERDAQIAGLHQSLAERGRQIASLNQAVAERDEQIASLNQAVAERDEQIASLNQAVAGRDGQVQSIISSRSWKLTKPIRLANRLARSIKYEDERYTLLKSIYWHLPEFLRYRLNRQRHAYIAKHLNNNITLLDQNNLSENLLRGKQSDWLVKANQARQVIIIPCGFEFDELVNQRPINAAKYFATEGYFVLFVAWQWSPQDTLSKGCRTVWSNIYQVPLFDLISQAGKLYHHSDLSLFLVTIPAPILVKLIPCLRQKGFAIVYDIMDDWEAFYYMGQAPWFKKSIEQSLVLQSDNVCAVSPALRDKFLSFRSDISIIGNGYTPDILGLGYKGIGGNRRENKRIIGYFGHLTDAWFDWRLVFDIASARADLIFEIIGYGEPDWIKQEAILLPNIRLIGKIAPKDLHYYTAGWSIAIIPFVKGILAEAVDPIKIYEYLYFGLPVIVTGIRHLQNYPMTYFAESHNILDVLDQVFQSNHNIDTLNIFLKQTTWSARFDMLINQVTNNQNMRYLYAN